MHSNLCWKEKKNLKEDKKISIIIPIYMVEKYLKRCIDSVTNQTYRNLEIILVNDGSKDNCEKICDEYKQVDHRIKVIHKENGGLSDARNAGLEIASGDYICFVDSDDVINCNYIKILYKNMIDNNADISECNFKRFNDDKQLEEINNIQNNKINKDIVTLTSDKMLEDRFYNKKYVVQSTVVWNKMYKKELYDKIRFPKGKLHEDEFTTYKIVNNANNIVITSDELYYYRQNQEGIMKSNFNEKRLVALEAIKQSKEFFKRQGKINIYNKVNIRYNDKLINNYCLTKKYIENSEEIQKKILKEIRENYKTINEINFTMRMLYKFVNSFPNLYYQIWKIMRKKYNP